MEIIVPFAEAIYKTNLISFKDKNQDYYNFVFKKNQELNTSQQSWYCDTFNCDLQDEILTQEIIKHVSLFCNKIGILNANITCVGSWINLAKHNSFQETHIHPKSHFSVVYYVKVTNNSGNIIFRNHTNLINLFPLPFDQNHATIFTYDTFKIIPKECDLLIFRSNLQHMVEKNNSNEDRVSISMNFKIDD